MKILYVVSNINTASQGIGGHYYSMLATSEALAKQNEVTILNIGTEESLALKAAKDKVVNIVDENLSTIKLLFRLIKFLKSNHFDTIHTFDDLAYFYVRVANISVKAPVVLTKCGGVNPRYYPFCKNVIHYSQENYKYFAAKKKFAKTKNYFIPNRVNPFRQDKERIASLSEKYRLNEYDVIFTRISRVGTTYEKSLKQLICLAESCKLENMSTCVLIIGAVVDQDVLKRLKGYSNTLKIFIESDPYYTSNAKELIDVGDVFLGTGRSFMEAALCKKIMFAPLKAHDYPVLVDEKNFMRLFETNFSERGNVSDFDPDSQQVRLRKLFNDQKALSNHKDKLFPFYRENFSLDSKLEVYNDIYKNCKPEEFFKNFYDVFLNYLFVQRRFFISKKLKNN